MELILIFSLLFVKHFVVDFLLQRRYQYENKGVYGHPGGLIHAGLHGLGSWLCLTSFDPAAAVALACADAGIHYHIDWAKTTINQRRKWTPAHSQYWYLLGLDQFLHYMTYVGMVLLMVE